jgi:hypothetical protein
MLFYTKTNIRGHEGNVRYGRSAASYDYRLLHLHCLPRNACTAWLRCSVADICSIRRPVYRFGYAVNM